MGTSVQPSRIARRAGALTLLLATVAVCAFGSVVGAAEEPAYRGRPLVEVLRELQGRGLDLIFSTAVVGPELRVTVEPSGTEPRALLEQILAPLALRAEDGPGGSVLIVPAELETGGLRGRVLSTAHGKPIAGATVRLTGVGDSAVTDASGSFEMAGIPEGTYVLSVEAFGFSLMTVPGVRVSSGDSASLNLELDEHPAFVTVVVTPGHHSLVHEEQASTHGITSEDTSLAPATGGDISRVLELLPGIAAADNSAAFNARGSVARDVSWVLDGLELYDPFHLQSFQSPFSLIDGGVVDRIDFFGGGFTADLGDRHGGFVEIGTLVPGETVAGEIELGTVNSRVAWGGPTGNAAGSWLVSVRGWYPNAATDTIEVGSGENLDPRFGDLYGKASFNLSPHVVLSAHGLLVYDRLTFNETDEIVNESVDVRTRNGYGWLRVLTSASSDWTSETLLSGGRIDRQRDGVSSPEDALIVEDDRQVDFIGLKHDSIWQVSEAHVLKAGVEARRLDARYRYSNIAPADPLASVLLRLDPSGTSVGLYAAHRVRVSESVTTELGLRWDRQTYTNDNQLSPRVNAVWRPGERSELRLALGRFTQSQRIHELHVEDGEREFLPAEAAEQAEMSFQYGLRGGVRLRADAYYRNLSDLRPRFENLFEPIELFPETTDDRVTIAPSKARLRGLEILARGAADRSVFWSASYALSSADDVIDGKDVPRSWDQTHAAKGLVGFQREDRWSVSLSGSAHTGWPTTTAVAELTTLPGGSTEIESMPGPRNSVRFPHYFRFDLKARRSFAAPGGRIWLTLEVANFTDWGNACCVNDFFFNPRPDGSVDVRTEFDQWLGRTASFNMLWEIGRRPRTSR